MKNQDHSQLYRKYRSLVDEYNSSVKYRKILFYMFFEVHRTH